ncbi:MAG: hypothetical protein LBJ10_08750, partial [Clostridiales bacterium]|jgi:hypothetical protein|nr:hypothetical protein [Clostridiales bacterium]
MPLGVFNAVFPVLSILLVAPFWSWVALLAGSPGVTLNYASDAVLAAVCAIVLAVDAIAFTRQLVVKRRAAAMIGTYFAAALSWAVASAIWLALLAAAQKVIHLGGDIGLVAFAYAGVSGIVQLAGFLLSIPASALLRRRQ